MAEGCLHYSSPGVQGFPTLVAAFWWRVCQKSMFGKQACQSQEPHVLDIGVWTGLCWGTPQQCSVLHKDTGVGGGLRGRAGTCLGSP